MGGCDALTSPPAPLLSAERRGEGGEGQANLAQARRVRSTRRGGDNLPRQVLVYQPVNSFMGVAPLAGLRRDDDLRGARRSGKANALMPRDPCEGCLSGHQPTLRRPAGEGACAAADDVGLPDASCSSQPAQGDPPRRAAPR